MHDTPDNRFANPEQRELETGKRLDEIRQDMRELIAKHGFTHIYVFDNEQVQAPYLYTVGRHLHNLPELIITGLFDQDDLGMMVSNFARDREGNPAPECRLMVLAGAFEVEGDTFNIRLVEIDPHHATFNYLVQAPIILQQPIERVQWIQISDAAGRWPGEAEFDNKFKQLFIGTPIATPDDEPIPRKQ